MQMFKDIGHPFAEGKPVYDVTFENVQAGERTSHLFRLANFHNALVLGTGDLSELALGWMTYGVGDHMSHYNVNVSVPKTADPHLIRWVVSRSNLMRQPAQTLEAILETEISPELVPHAEGRRESRPRKPPMYWPLRAAGFFLYYITRYGLRPSKVAFLAHHAWADKERGDWPDLLPEEKHSRIRSGDDQKMARGIPPAFFQIQPIQTERHPNGPKVGSGGSLSPRGDWRAPSDSEAEVWLRELRDSVPD